MVVVAALLLSVPALGCWPVLGAAVGLYYLLVFFNALEQRDLDDSTKQQRTRTKQTQKKDCWAALRGGPACLFFRYRDSGLPVGGVRTASINRRIFGVNFNDTARRGRTAPPHTQSFAIYALGLKRLLRRLRAVQNGVGGASSGG